MICKNCEKEVNKPLVLYDGRLACPYCTKELIALGEFRVSEESEEYYLLARQCFYRWLSNPAEETKKYLERCVEFCTEAARAGHPKAAVFLGYLYEKEYADESRGRIEQCRIAYGYYSAICYNEHTSVTGNVSGYTAEVVKEIKLGAARQLLTMLSSLSALVPNGTQSRMDFERNREKLLALYPSLTEISGRSTSVEVNRVRQIGGILRSCFSSVRAPLFGIVRLTNDELKELFEERTSGKTLYQLCRMGTGFELRHVSCGENHLVSERSEDRFQTLANQRSIREYLGGLGKGSGYLYYFSSAGKHAYLSKGQMARVGEALGEKGCLLVRQLINKGGQQEYTFFDDDIVKCKTGLSFAKAAERLVDEVVQPDLF